jgi:hypothetical protein
MHGDITPKMKPRLRKATSSGRIQSILSDNLSLISNLPFYSSQGRQLPLAETPST